MIKGTRSYVNSERIKTSTEQEIFQIYWTYVGVCKPLLWLVDWPWGYKTFFKLNSVEHEILNAHKYKNIKKFGFFRLKSL